MLELLLVSEDEVVVLLLGVEFVSVELADVLLVDADEIAMLIGELVDLFLFAEKDEMDLL